MICMVFPEILITRSAWYKSRFYFKLLYNLPYKLCKHFFLSRTHLNLGFFVPSVVFYAYNGKLEVEFISMLFYTMKSSWGQYAPPVWLKFIARIHFSWLRAEVVCCERHFEVAHVGAQLISICHLFIRLKHKRYLKYSRKSALSSTSFAVVGTLYLV